MSDISTSQLTRKTQLVDRLLRAMVEKNGSDLHLIAGNPPRFRLHGDLQVLEPVAAPRDFRMRFAWSGRNNADPGNTWLRQTVIAAYATYQADINRQMHDVAVPLNG